ncbi:MAG: acylneuraminate cytidylyltransferase family protein [Gammaproteobacteria bacterium]|nr:acylneuraminate cytidylyltransferase family protein [Gammaproteobacteria bacterium]
MKANSERVIGKNFKSLAGKPLFKWILDSLLAVEEIDQVIINTDARNILLENNLVESNKVIIRDRKPELCGDLVSMNLILADDIENIDADMYLMTHTTNPLLSSNSILNAISCFENKSDQHDSLFMVNKIQTRFYKENMEPVNHDPDNLIRTQDLEPWYEENSCLYLFSKQSFDKTNARIGSKPMMYTTPPLEAIDIDEPEDWIMAEALALHSKNKENN